MFFPYPVPRLIDVGEVGDTGDTGAPIAIPQGPNPVNDPKGWLGWWWGQPQDVKTVTLDPALRAALIGLFGALRAEGFNPAHTNGWRHPATQAGFVASGRSGATFSKHNVVAYAAPGVVIPAALATDLYDDKSGKSEVSFYRALKRLAPQYGLDSGANWFGKKSSPWYQYGLGWDPMHVELPVSMSTARANSIAAIDRAATELGDPIVQIEHQDLGVLGELRSGNFLQRVTDGGTVGVRRVVEQTRRAARAAGLPEDPATLGAIALVMGLGVGALSVGGRNR